MTSIRELQGGLEGLREAEGCCVWGRVCGMGKRWEEGGGLWLCVEMRFGVVRSGKLSG